MGEVEAGVDDADLDPLTGEAGALPDGRDTQERHADRVVNGMHLESADPHNARELGKAGHLLSGDLDADAVVGVLELADDRTALRGDVIGDRVLRSLEVGLDRVLLRLAQLAAGLGLDHGDGLAGHLDHDGDRRGVVGRLGQDDRVDDPFGEWARGESVNAGGSLGKCGAGKS